MMDDSRTLSAEAETPSSSVRDRHRRWSWLEVLIVALIIVFLVIGCQAVLIGHAMLTASPRSRDNLKQLAAAMMACHENQRAFPAPALCGKDGRPLLSWRVALLPYLGESRLYSEFHLDEPWDSEHNQSLRHRMPAVYASPVPGKAKKPGLTYYQVFVGDGAAFAEGKRMRLPADFQDGASNTILIVEAGQPVSWTKPEDVLFDPHKPLPPLGGLFSDHFNVAFADANVRYISKRVTEATLRCLVTRSGGDPLVGDW
jgi:hypothetical protein